MEPITDWSGSLEQGLLNAYVSDSRFTSDDADRPKLIANQKSSGTNLLSVIKEQFSTCRSFDFCVAFIADSGLQPLVEVLNDLKRRGIKGRFLTSTYLNFNSPAALSKLLEYDNIEVRVYEGNLHAKGYVFDQDGISTVIIGSSNLTQNALTCNREWNLLFRSYDEGSLLNSLRDEFESLWTDANTQKLSKGWIEHYQEFWVTRVERTPRQPAYHTADAIVLAATTASPVIPNKMQKSALEALDVVHKRHDPRALLVSATGTGKTYLSAFDIANIRPKRVLFLVHRQRILDASMQSFENLLGGIYTYACYAPGNDSKNATCLFAMCSTMVRHLDEFAKDAFDYIIIDEAHRAGSLSYQKIVNYFEPDFYLGMTATPNRTDGYDIFALFNHVIAYQITLQDALENDMLAPFHYFGIADLSIDDEDIDDPALFSKLTSSERVRHITEKIEEYTVDKLNRRGLIFCNRNDEAQALSESFNKLSYRTLAISGASDDAARNKAIERLENGELEYIFSVDIFNEGVDIPSLNQIIMLRRTESAIVFVQQLGRGLRKVDGKEFTLVLDFIGNYQKNFFVPVALSGDKTYNKDRLRRIVQEGSSAIPGCSTVSFDRISEARIYKAIDGGDFTAARFLKNEYLDLRQQLGHIPSLEEFDKNASIDPLLIFKKYGSYHAFLLKNEDSYDVKFSAQQESILKFVSQKMAHGKCFEDLFVLRELLDKTSASEEKLRVAAMEAYSWATTSARLLASKNVMTGTFNEPAGFVPLISKTKDFVVSDELKRALSNAEFKKQLLAVIDFGLSRHEANYATAYGGTEFVLNEKYTYEEVCRLFGWSKNINGQNMGGYKYDAETNTFPVFINYDKAPDVDASIAYEDRFISDNELVAISKSGRRLTSPEIQRLQAWPDNGMKIYLFMRKNKDDEGSKEFYFLGEMEPTGMFKPFEMRPANKPAVEIGYRLKTPVRHDIYAFMLSDLDAAE